MNAIKKSLAFILSAVMLTNGMDLTVVHAEDEFEGELSSEEVIEELHTEETETPEFVEGSEEESGADLETELVAEEVREETPVEEQPQGVENTKTEYVYEDDAYKVIATLSDPNAISDEAALKVKPVTSQSEQYNYDAYMDALNQNDSEDTYTEENTTLLDVAFILNDEEVQPVAGTVDVTVDFKQQEVQSEDFEVVHLPINEEAKEKTTAESTEISVSDITVDTMINAEVTDTEVAFNTDSFCVFAFKKNDQVTTTEQDPNAKPNEGTYWDGDGEAVSVKEFADQLGIAKNVAVYANEFDSNVDHLEGSIAVKRFKETNNNHLNANNKFDSHNTLKKVEVTKTLDQASGSDSTFNFVIVNANNNKEYDFEITVPANSTSAVKEFDENSELVKDLNSYQNSQYFHVYEIDEKGNRVANNGKYLAADGTEKYTVTYGSNSSKDVEGNDIIPTLDTFGNYIGTIYHNNPNSNDLDAKYFGDKSYPTYTTTEFTETFMNGVERYLHFKDGNGKTLTMKGDVANVIHVDPDEFERLTKLNANLGENGEFAKLSTKLANQKFGTVEGDEYFNVINLVSSSANLMTDFNNASFNEFQNGQAISDLLKDHKGYLLINIDVTAVKDQPYQLTKIVIDGSDPDSDSSFNELNSRVVYNFVVKEDGAYKPFKGTISNAGNVIGGTVFAPLATFVQKDGVRGTVIADVAEYNGAEYHQQGFHSKDDLIQKITVSNTTISDDGEHDETSFVPYISKKITNKPASVNPTFRFNLYEVSDVNEDITGKTPIDTVSTTGEQVVSFKSLSYSETGSHIYKVEEVNDGQADYTYDAAAVKTFTVNVTKDTNGKLTAGSTNSNTNPVQFTNEYHHVEEKGSLEIRKEVTVDGQPTTTTKVDGTYTFTVTNSDQSVTKETSITITDGKSNTATVTDLPLGTYTVTEATPSNSDIKVVNNNQKVTLTSSNKVGVVTVRNNLTEKAVEDAEIVFNVRKTVNQKIDWNDFNTAFIFNLTGVNGAPVPSNTTVSVNGAGTVSFGAIKFSQEGTYRYEISEVKGTDSRVAYDNHTEYVTVKVTKNTAGDKLVAKAYYANTDVLVDQNTVNFNNTFTLAPTADEISIEKALDAKAQKYVSESGKTFTFGFTLQNVNDPSDTKHVDITYGLNGNKATFAPIGFASAGTYVYRVSEDDFADESYNGWVKDNTVYTYTYNVKADEKGSLYIVNNKPAVTATDAKADTNNVTFHNSYDTKSTSVTLEVKKEVEGTPENIVPKTFTFKLEGTSANTKNVLETKNVTAPGKDTESFALTYTESGTYEYDLTEVNTGANGYTYSKEKYHIVVTVADEGGQLKAAVSYTARDGRKTDVAEGKNANLTFVNSYKAAKTSFTPYVKKVVENKSDETRTFAFELREGTKLLQTIYVSDQQVAEFKALTYDKAGTHTYTIVENETHKAGYDYDSAKEFTVEVTDNGEGKLVATSTVNQSNPVTLTNYYHETTADISLDKHLAGRDLQDGEFNFVLSADNALAQNVLNTPETVSNKNGKVSFTTLHFNEEGDYAFTVTEQSTNQNGVTNDPNATRHITVHVTKNAEDHTLAATVEYMDGTSFENEYQAKETNITLGVQKTVNGSAAQVQNAPVFEFALRQITTENTPVVLANEVTKTVTGTGSVNFDQLTFNQAGEYHFAVREVKGNASGYTYAEGEQEIIVIVTDDLKGALHASANRTTVFTFDNQYHAEGTSAEIALTKTVTGHGALENAEGKTFRFTLTGTNVSETKEVTYLAGGDNRAVFNLTFDHAGTYQYQLSENATSYAGWSIDPATYSYEYLVVDDGTGTLKVAEGYPVVKKTAGKNSDTISAEAVFNNTYDADKVTFYPSVTKVVNNQPAEHPVNTKFEFDLVSEDGKYTDVLTSTNGGKFKGITYDEAGTYTYFITEKDLTDTYDFYSYDSKSYTLTVVVSQDENGWKTEASYTVDGDETAYDTAEFINTFKTFDTEAEVTVTKKFASDLALSKAAGKTFRFTLSDAEGNAVDHQSVTIGENNDYASFKKLTFKAPGTYVYFVTEDDLTDASLAGFTKDSNAYRVEYQVTVDAEGRLHAEVKEQNADAVTVTNDYHQEAVDVVVPVTKLFADETALTRAMGHTFNFTLSGLDTELHTGVTINAEASTGEFAPLHFESEGTYTYEITEDEIDRTVNAGFVKDDHVYVLTVEVTDEGGVLKASTTIRTEGKETDLVSFTNKYTYVVFNKYNTDGEVLAGSTFNLLETSLFASKIIDIWTSNGAQAHDISELVESGKSYRIEEVNAPEGYTLAEPIDFKVTKDGEIVGLENEAFDGDTLKYVDAKLDVTVSKVASDTKNTLTGAHLQIFDQNGQLVDEWMSEETAHTVKGLKPGETYTLHEAAAPEGYTLAEDITFTLGMYEAKKTIVMEDEKVTINRRPTVPETDDDKPTAPVTPERPSRRRPMTPDTSDSSDPALWGGLAGGMIVLFGILVFFKKKRES